MKKLKSNKRFFNIVSSFLFSVGCFYISVSYAAGGSDTGISGIAGRVTESFKSFAKLITAGSFLAGLALAFMAILEFKKYKDKPGQALSKPVGYLIVAVAFLFMPYVVKSVGYTLFQTSDTTGSISGSYSI